MRTTRKWATNMLSFWLGISLLGFAPDAWASEPLPDEKDTKIQVIVIADEKGEKKIRVEVNDEEISIVDSDGKRRKIVRKRLKTARRGFLGVYLTSLTPELRQHFGAKANEGVMVAKLVSGGPAEKAGIMVGDVIVAIDGAKMDTAWDIGSAIGDKKDGEKADVKILRASKAMNLRVAVQSRKRPVVDLSPCIKKGPHGIVLDPDACGEQIEREVKQALRDAGIEEKLKGIEIHKLKKLKHIDGLEEKLEQRLEEKMKKLEQKLQKLEKKLQGKLLSPKAEAVQAG
ncbi:MAG: PDZ domain-containing protein [Deltaproteobacteria bacterium]|nr:PDZ domain-containing protein [Deltaproteobacteria bacterium]